ncbi:MAG: hypothetical protein IPM98_16655 [Lewinellaceae bacterium]|nr:hypothetical protein [Lewinellaceae bacterium]
MQSTPGNGTLPDATRRRRSGSSIPPFSHKTNAATAGKGIYASCYETDIFLILVAATWCSCSDTPTTRYTANCYVRYLKPEAQLLAETVLHAKTPDQPEATSAEAPEGVRYRGTLMRALDLQGTTTYRTEQTGGYAPEHTFTWKDNRQQPHTVQMNLPPISAFSFNSETISRTNPATLTWDGAPLDKNESLAMIWVTTDGGKTVPMEIIGNPGQDRIEFPAAQLSKLEPGTWKLYLVRKKSIQSEQPDTTVRCTAEYYTDEIVVTVTN